MSHLRGYCSTLCDEAAHANAQRELLRRLVFIGLLRCELRPVEVEHGGHS
ncbi:hypothetical protein ACLEPN_30555 [Myxococcus sp. 1LA]